MPAPRAPRPPHEQQQRDEHEDDEPRAARAATMLALVDRVLTRTERVATPPASTMTRELKGAIVGYLGSYEAI